MSKDRRRGGLEGSGPERGGPVAAVNPGSPAADAGVKSGDLVVALDGRQLRDVIDYQFLLEPGVRSLEIERDGRRFEAELEVEEGIDPGIVFSSVIFDRIRTCSNCCVFCFVDQAPRGLRRPLYLKDDDYRLSFLHGNFITLGNLRPDDIDRIIDQRLSPLYVSLHATDPEIRGKLMGCGTEAAALGLANLKMLGQAGIVTHVQIVLCPGINDGETLERSVMDLASDYPGAATAGIVPVAVADGFRRMAAKRDEAETGLRPVSAGECVQVIDAVAGWQEKFCRELGSGFVYAADEFFLVAGRSLPPLEYYDDLAQYENGIGNARSFLEEGDSILDEIGVTAVGAAAPVAGAVAPDTPGRIFMLTGVLAAELMQEFCQTQSRERRREILPLVVPNRLFGPHVTVTGLLGGREIAAEAAAAGLRRGDLLLIPPSVLDRAGERFLDDLSLEELQETLACDIAIISGTQ